MHVQECYTLIKCHTSIGGLVALDKGGDGIGASRGSQHVRGSNPLAATLGLALLYGWEVLKPRLG
jgi:hypothetical protein